MVRTAARFESTFAKPKSGESGAGELASMLAAGLRAKGFSPAPIEDQEYAHCFKCPSGEREYEVMVAFDFNDGRTWEVSCPPVLGWLARLRATEEREHSQLISAIDSVLHSDGRIADIRWYRSYGDKSDPSPSP
jgi:hypothetical protein